MVRFAGDHPPPPPVPRSTAAPSSPVPTFGRGLHQHSATPSSLEADFEAAFGLGDVRRAAGGLPAEVRAVCFPPSFFCHAGTRGWPSCAHPIIHHPTISSTTPLPLRRSQARPGHGFVRMPLGERVAVAGDAAPEVGMGPDGPGGRPLSADHRSPRTARLRDMYHAALQREQVGVLSCFPRCVCDCHFDVLATDSLLPCVYVRIVARFGCSSDVLPLCPVSFSCQWMIAKSRGDSLARRMFYNLVYQGFQPDAVTPYLGHANGARVYPPWRVWPLLCRACHLIETV